MWPDGVSDVSMEEFTPRLLFSPPEIDFYNKTLGTIGVMHI